MKPTRFMMAMLGAIVFIGIAGAGAEFELAPINPEFLGEASPFRQVYCRFVRDVRFDKLPPDAKGSIRYGRFAPDGLHVMKFAAYASGGRGDPDTLVFDVNGDKDLTNDAKFTGLTDRRPTEVKLPLPQGGEAAIKIMLSSWYLTVESTTWWKGSIAIDGKKVAAAMVDADGGGVSSAGSTDYLLIDLNGNGKFDVDFKKRDTTEALRLQPELLVGGNLYAADIDAAKPDLKLTPYEGTQGKLSLDLRFPMNIAGYEFTGYTMEGETMNIVSASQSDFPVAMKVGTWRLIQGTLTMKNESGKRTTVRFSMNRLIIIEAGKTTVLALGDHEPFEVNVTQNGGKLSVTQSLANKSGVVYATIDTIPGGQPKGPKVRILDLKGNLLAQGSMEYG